MSKYSKWTNEQVNEMIFEAKGWQKYLSDNKTTIWIKCKPEDSVWFDDCWNAPDYTHDWRLCGELLEEIGHHASVVNLQCDHTGYTCYIRRYPTSTAKLIATHSNDTPFRSICEGWLEWEENNK